MSDPAVITNPPSSVPNSVNEQVVSGTDADGNAVFTPGSTGFSGIGPDGKTYGPVCPAPNFPPIPPDPRGRY